jgi:hypothetical protein
MRTSRMFAGVVLASLVLGLTLSMAPPAQAVVASSVTIHWSATDEVFHGKVSSSNAECVAHRAVKVFQKTSSGPQLVGKTTSAKQGGWILSLMAHSGKYFAKTPQQTIMSIDCGGARSKAIDVM